MKIIVTGASGFVGRDLLKKLSRNGYEIVAVTRQLNESQSVKIPHVTWVQKNLVEKNDYGFMAHADAVIHLAGEKHDEKRMYEVNVEGTRNLLENAARAGIPKFIHLSSAGVYGYVESKRVTECTARDPMNKYEDTKKQAEDMFQPAVYTGKWIILRPTNIFDKKTIRFYQSLTLCSLLKWLVKGNECTHWVYLEDVTDCIEFMIKTDLSQSKTFNLSCVEGETFYFKEMMSMVHPSGLIKWLFRLFSFPVKVPYMLRKFKNGRTNVSDLFYDPEKLHAAGFQMKYGTIIGIRHCMDMIHNENIAPH